MQIHYDEQEDILVLLFNELPITKDVSLNWNVNIGMTEQGVGEISILDAKASGLLPLSIEPSQILKKVA